MSVSSVIGQIITADQVEDAVRAHLELWMPTYIGELERQLGYAPADIPMIRSYATTTEFDSYVEEQLPRVMIISTGMAQVPERHGDGAYNCRFAVAIGVVASARTQAETNRMAKIYAAAIRASIVQHRSLTGFALGVEWIGEQYDDLGADEMRSLAGGRVTFEVEVASVIKGEAGPIDPGPDPYVAPEDWPLADTVDVIVEAVEELP